MGGIAGKIDEEIKKAAYSYMEKDRTHPCYEIVLKKDFQPVEEPPKLPKVSSKKITLSLTEFNDQMKFIVDELENFKSQDYIMMINKPFVFDRKNASLFPRFEYCNLPSFSTANRPLYNYPGFYFDDLRFEPMTQDECLKSFTVRSGNPYINEDGTFKYFATKYKKLILVLGWQNRKSCCVSTKGTVNY